MLGICSMVLCLNSLETFASPAFFSAFDLFFSFSFFHLRTTQRSGKASSRGGDPGLAEVTMDDIGTRSNCRLHSLDTQEGALWCHFVGKQP